METLPGCSVEGGLAGSKNGVGAGGETTSGAQRRGRGSEERSLQQGHKETIFTAASVRDTYHSPLILPLSAMELFATLTQAVLKL